MVILARRDLLDRLRGLGNVRPDIDVPNAPQPVSPGKVAILYVEGLIRTMIPQAREEDSASQKRYLESLEVYVHAIPVPGPRPNPASNEPREQSVEVEDEQDAQDGGEETEDEEYPTYVLVLAETKDSDAGAGAGNTYGLKTRASRAGAALGFPSTMARTAALSIWAGC